MTNFAYSAAVLYLICITVASSIPVAFSSRPFPADAVTEGAAVLDSSNGELNHPTVPEVNAYAVPAVFSEDLDLSETETNDEAYDDLDSQDSFGPCGGSVADSEGESDSGSLDVEAEPDCRRMLGSDYPDSKPNKNPKKRGLLELSTELGASEQTTEPSSYSAAIVGPEAR